MSDDDSSDISGGSFEDMDEDLINIMVILGFRTRNWKVMALLVLYLLRRLRRVTQDEEEEDDELDEESCDEQTQKLEESSQASSQVGGPSSLPPQKAAFRGSVSQPSLASHQNTTTSANQPKASTATTCSGKRPASDTGDDGKKQRGRPRKKVKTTDDEDSERESPEECLQDPFEMIEIEEPIIKDEVFETEEFNVSKCEEVVPSVGSTQERAYFETVYCNPAIVKVEREDDIEEMPSTFQETETGALSPDFMRTGIKVEPPEEEEDEEDEELEELPAPPPAPLLWRCPLVSCPEMFTAEMEMYQHLNLNHAVKGLAQSSKSKKSSGPRSTTTEVIPSISGAGGLVFITSASPLMSSVATVTSVSSPVVTCQSVPSSSSGPVTVTTTFSYTSIATSSAPCVTTVSSSAVSCVPSAALISSATPAIPVTSTSNRSTSCPPASSPITVSTTVPDCSDVGVIDQSRLANDLSDPLSATTVSPGLAKLNVTPVSDHASGSRSPKTFLLLAPHAQPPQQTSATKSSQLRPILSPAQQSSVTKHSQAMHIFQNSEFSIEDELPPSATDESEMFSISLAQFPRSRRVPIKRKLIEVVDCVKQKNISPDKLIIAYYENSSDSRTM